MIKPGMRITGAGKVIAAFRSRSLAARKQARVDVGFSAPYAARIHEDLALVHPNGIAKYLEQPQRQYKQEMARIVVFNLNNKESLTVALERAGWFLLQQAQLLVPVLTGNLRDSGYVKVAA